MDYAQCAIVYALDSKQTQACLLQNLLTCQHITLPSQPIEHNMNSRWAEIAKHVVKFEPVTQVTLVGK